MKKTENLLNQNSDRYRICPHPECRKPHLVKNRGRDYCSDKCADDHYNLLRRLKKQTEQFKVQKGNTISLEPQQLNSDRISKVDGNLPMVVQEELSPNQTQNESATNGVNLESAKTATNPMYEIRQRNIYILDEHPVGNKSIELSIDYLNSINYDFTIYDKRRKLKKCDLFLIEIGIYTLLWTKKNKMLITKTINSLWI